MMMFMGRGNGVGNWKDGRGGDKRGGMKWAEDGKWARAEVGSPFG